MIDTAAIFGIFFNYEIRQVESFGAKCRVSLCHSDSRGRNAFG